MLASDEAAREEIQPQKIEAVNSDRKEKGSLFAALASSPLMNYLIFPYVISYPMLSWPEG